MCDRTSSKFCEHINLTHSFKSLLFSSYLRALLSPLPCHLYSILFYFLVKLAIKSVLSKHWTGCYGTLLWNHTAMYPADRDAMSRKVACSQVSHFVFHQGLVHVGYEYLHGFSSHVCGVILYEIALDIMIGCRLLLQKSYVIIWLFMETTNINVNKINQRTTEWPI